MTSVSQDLLTAFELERPSPPLSEVAAPIVYCDGDGQILNWTQPAGQMLLSLKLVSALPAHLPPAFWEKLCSLPTGEAMEWRLSHEAERLLGCTRYRARGGFLLLLKEVSHQRAAISKMLQRQRLEVTGRLVASIAHELRNAVASVSYNAQLIELTCERASHAETREVSASIQTAAKHLESTVQGLLEYARAAPLNSNSISLVSVVNRAQGFVRAAFRQAGHTLSVSLAPDAQWVRGNSIAVEQVLVNLFLNSGEAARKNQSRASIRVESSLERAPGRSRDSSKMVRVQVMDDGPGIPSHLRDYIFQPFFTTSEEGTGLGLTNALEAIREMQGDLILEPSTHGAHFSIYFPAGAPDGAR